MLHSITGGKFPKLEINEHRDADSCLDHYCYLIDALILILICTLISLARFLSVANSHTDLSMFPAYIFTPTEADPEEKIASGVEEISSGGDYEGQMDT